MKSIRSLTSEGPRGPAYIRFSDDPVANTEPWGDGTDEDVVVVDYDAAGAVVGIELVSLGHDAIKALVEIANLKDLDLSALLAHSFAVSPVA